MNIPPRTGIAFMLRQALFFAGFALFSSLTASAQTRDPASFRDSLATVTDVVALNRLERSLDAPGTAASIGPLLERGLIAHRIYQITGDRDDAVRSRDAFQKATQRFPSDPWGHYGTALALFDGPEKRITALGGALSDVTLVQSFAEILRKDPLAKARRELRAALEIKPSFGDAAVLLSQLAVVDGGRSQALIREARDALVQARRAGAESNSLPTAIARMETALGNYDEAARVAEAAGNAGDASAMVARATALMLQPGYEAVGGNIYASAIAALTPEAAALLYDDVQVLLTPSEAAEWKGARTIDQQKKWLTRFWDKRAAESGVSVAERQSMHYRRLALAKKRYLRDSKRGTGGAGILTAEKPVGSYPFDQRGVILVRHGVPITVISTSIPAVVPNESWVYDIPGIGRQTFHFAILRGAQDYALVSDITKLVDPLYNTAENAVVRNRALLELLQDRVQYEPAYGPALGRLTAVFQRVPQVRLDDQSVRSILASSESDYRQGAREALRTDSYRRAYEDSIPYMYDIFTMRSPFARTELTAVLAVPSRSLVPLLGSAGTRYGLRIGVILMDTLQNSVTRLDTTVVIDEGRLLAPSDYVRTHVTLPVIPSAHTMYKISAEDIVSGRGALVDGVHSLRDYSSSDRLLVSDIVLAIPDSAGEWKRGPQRLALALPRAFEPARPFTVFYEVYNFQPGEAYSTRITVTPGNEKGAGRRILGIFGTKGPAVDVTFDGVAQPDTNGVVQEIRKVASDLAPGTYRLSVQVTGKSSGRTAATETVFTVTD